MQIASPSRHPTMAEILGVNEFLVRDAIAGKFKPEYALQQKLIKLARCIESEPSHSFDWLRVKHFYNQLTGAPACR